MDAMPLCTQCGFTWGEYRSRGLLGCPHCYAAFGEALQGDLFWIHRALTLSGAPGASGEPDAPVASVTPVTPVTPTTPGQIAQWKERLAEAVRKEDYSEAARLQKLLGGRPGLDSHDALG